MTIIIALSHYMSSTAFAITSAQDFSEITKVLLLIHRLSVGSPEIQTATGQAVKTAPAGMSAAVSSTRTPVPAKKTIPPASESEMGELSITPTKVEQVGKSMVVSYLMQKRGAGAIAYTKTIRCWDPSQFGDLLASQGQSTTFLTKTTKEGFANIVGVKR